MAPLTFSLCDNEIKITTSREDQNFFFGRKSCHSFWCHITNFLESLYWSNISNIGFQISKRKQTKIHFPWIKTEAKFLMTIFSMNWKGLAVNFTPEYFPSLIYNWKIFFECLLFHGNLPKGTVNEIWHLIISSLVVLWIQI